MADSTTGAQSAPLPKGRPIRTEFQAALDAIDDALVSAAVEVADQLPLLTNAFMNGDNSSIEAATAMSARVADACLRIEDDGFLLLAREAPVAGDLRRLVALLRLTTDVDRSAALLRHVSETLYRFDPRFLPDDMRLQLQELATRATAVFRAGIDAWRRRDALAVTEVDRLDDAVDKLQETVLLRAAELEEERSSDMIVLGLIARYYERIADHGVAIAQDAAFVATGQRVRIVPSHT